MNIANNLLECKGLGATLKNWNQKLGDAYFK